MHRFFVHKNQINLEQNTINIVEEDVRHIKDVLRIAPEEIIEIVCDEIVYICMVKALYKNSVETKILKQHKGKNESKLHINLYQGIAKGSKMDLIIQKATEIGVKEVYPIISDRTVVKINDMKKENKKVDRWNKIALEAAKQSKRDVVPVVHNIITLENVLNLLENEHNIIVPYENEENVHIGDIMKDLTVGKIHIIIGPEGGFEYEEIERLQGIKSKIVSLGPRILRTETAGLVAASILMYELGDI